MRGLLGMLLIFMAGAGAAIWWGTHTLQSADQSSAKSSDSTQSSTPQVATKLNPILPQETAERVVPEITAPQLIEIDDEQLLPIEPKTVHASPRADPLLRAQQALARDPFHPAALRDAARLSIERQETEEAKGYLSRLLVLDPDDALSRASLAELAFDQQAWTTVANTLEPIAPKNRDALQWRMLARTYSQLGKVSAAREAWAAVMETSPDDSVAQVEYAATSIELGKLADAEQLLESALQTNPRSVPALNLMGRYQWLRYRDSDGQNQTALLKAATAWEASLKIDPAQPDIAANIAAIRGASN